MTTPHAPDVTHALSIRQPWASLILAGIKRYEVRTWEPPSLGRFAIHASQSIAPNWKGFSAHPYVSLLLRQRKFPIDPNAWTRSAIVGVVTVVKAHKVETAEDWPSDYTLTDLTLCGDPYAQETTLWWIKAPVAFREPIPASGKLNLWRLSPSQQAQVAVRLRRSPA